MRTRIVILAFVAVLAAAIGIFWASFVYFEGEQKARAKGQLSLYRSTIVAELEKFSHLTYVLARDPFVIGTAKGGDRGLLNARLERFADEAGVFAIYLMDPTGLTIAASNHDHDVTYVGQNYGFRPYFQEAFAGTQSQYYAIGATTGLPGYFIADPVRDRAGDVLGVIAIKLHLDALEDSWREAGEDVFLADENGVILLASDPSWLYQSLADLTPAARAKIGETRQFMNEPLTTLDWRVLDEDRAVLAGDQLLHLEAKDIPNGWQLHYFADYSPALTRSLLGAGLFTILAILALSFTQFRYGRRIGAALRRSEAEEAQLRQANERLAVEIEERRTAERRLERTQDELERAGRLAALGQLSASVTHELGQPIAAMRNHLAAAEMSDAGPTRAMPKIEELVDRMEGITRQLKFFAHTEGEGFAVVDLREALSASLSLVAPNIESGEVDLQFAPPPEPVLIWGSKLRIEQVMVNLLRNAVDAMEGEDTRLLTVEIGSNGRAWFTIRDSGHGLGDSTLATLQEPFVTTRESGRGMGLGLAISSNIVAEHDGHLTAENAPDGGAIFKVDLPLYGSMAQDEAAE